MTDGEIGLSLFELFVDLIDFQLLFFKAGDQFGVIELNDQIFFLGQRANFSELGYLHGSEEVRSG